MANLGTITSTTDVLLGTALSAPTVGPRLVDCYAWPSITGIAAANPCAGSANGAQLSLVFLPHRVTINRLIIWISTQSGNIDVGMYLADGAAAAPLTRAVSSGSVACPAGGYSAITVSATELAPGAYYASISGDNTTFTMGYQGVYSFLNALHIQRYRAPSSFPLPTTITGLVSQAGPDQYIVVPGIA